MPDGCQTTFRIPNPGSGSGLNVPSTLPAKDKMNSLYCCESLSVALVHPIVVTDLQGTFPDSDMTPSW